MSGFVSDFMKISRVNIQVASLPHALSGILLAAPLLSSIASWDVLAYVILVFLMITFACNLNCLCDVDVDRKYKTYMSSALESIGAGKVKKLLILELALICVLLYALLSYGHVTTVLLSVAGTFLIFAYSAEPLRLKKHGVLSLLPVFIGLYTLPVLAGWFLLRADLPFYMIVFTLGYALMNEGITLVNTCEDYAEDRESGISTWAHVFGLRKTLLVAFIFTLIGGLSAASAFLLIIPPLATNPIPLVFVAISFIAIIKTSIDIYKIQGEGNLESAAKKHAKKMPKWFMATRYPLLFAALTMLL